MADSRPATATYDAVIVGAGFAGMYMVHGFFGMSLIIDKAKQAVGEVAGALKTGFAAQPV